MSTSMPTTTTTSTSTDATRFTSQPKPFALVDEPLVVTVSGVTPGVRLAWEVVSPWTDVASAAHLTHDVVVGERAVDRIAFALMRASMPTTSTKSAAAAAAATVATTHNTHTNTNSNDVWCDAAPANADGVATISFTPRNEDVGKYCGFTLKLWSATPQRVSRPFKVVKFRISGEDEVMSPVARTHTESRTWYTANPLTHPIVARLSHDVPNTVLRVKLRLMTDTAVDKTRIMRLCDADGSGEQAAAVWVELPPNKQTVVKYRITEVSKNHEGAKFHLVVEPGPAHGNVAPWVSEAILSLSKKKNKKRVTVAGLTSSAPSFAPHAALTTATAASTVNVNLHAVLVAALQSMRNTVVLLEDAIAALTSGAAGAAGGSGTSSTGSTPPALGGTLALALAGSGAAQQLVLQAASSKTLEEDGVGDGVGDGGSDEEDDEEEDASGSRSPSPPHRRPVRSSGASASATTKPASKRSRR